MTDFQVIISIVAAVLSIIGANIGVSMLIFLALNRRIDDVKDLIRSEVQGLTQAILRVEGILDARLKHLEEK